MENKFIPDAIDIISKAIQADNDGEFEKALSLYRDALGRFTLGLKYEKNEQRRKLVLERVEGYMKRAEELRDYLLKQSELDNKGGGGAATKSREDKDEDDDAEKKEAARSSDGCYRDRKTECQMVRCRRFGCCKRIFKRDCDYAYKVSSAFYRESKTF